MQALTQVVPPLLPPPPSWYPGHMAKFARNLPTLLTRTDVILEVRDARLPLTSINTTLEAAIQQWRFMRGRVARLDMPSSFASRPLSPARAIAGPNAIALASSGTGTACERLIVFNKRDLVPEWGIEPFKRAWESRFPGQRVFFSSRHRREDIKALNSLLVNLANEHPESTELNVLVVGMPNVGKSSLLNALRSQGIRGRTPHAFKTSSNPGLTMGLSTRVRLSEKPLVYAYDSPGMMLPYLGKGDRGAERAVKIALIAGIKQGLYDIETLVEYLLYRMNALNPFAPAYLAVLPPSTPPTANPDHFLRLLASRLAMLRKYGEYDLERAANWFINWWRDGAMSSEAAPNTSALIEASTLTQILHANSAGPSLAHQHPAEMNEASVEDSSSSSETASTSNAYTPHEPRIGWGFDVEFPFSPEEAQGAPLDALLQRGMENCIDAHVWAAHEEHASGGSISRNQERQKVKAERAEKRKRRDARVAHDWRPKSMRR